MNTDNQVRVCTPICEKSWSALEAACRRAESLADVIELRLDCLDEAGSPDLPLRIDDLVRNVSRPVILTLRPASEGGHCALSDEARAHFWKHIAERDTPAWWDVEASLLNQLRFSPDWSHIISSHHNFNGVPTDLDSIYQQISSGPAEVIKIAVQGRDATDCLPVFRLIARARRDGRNIIAITMDNAGLATRVLGPSRGAFLTYGPIESEDATAPGQITAGDLRSIYRIDRITDETMICGLIGLPVVHSVSPHMHNAAFEAMRVDGVFIPFEVNDVASFFKRMVNPRTREVDWRLRGLAVTAPHKLKVMECLDWVDDDAREIGAVNTVVIENDQLRGYNTDADGFLEPLNRRLGSLDGLRVAVVGAGGAARAVLWGLQKNRSKVTVFARDQRKARLLSERFGNDCQSLDEAPFGGYDIVINATPLGSIGERQDETPATASQLKGARIVYDLVYNPVDTRLLQEAKVAGCETLSGLEMLVAQGRLQFSLWTDRTVEFSVMYERAALALRNH